MPNQMHALVNDFAIRSFRETADKDYIAARMAYRARLFQPFLWSALHCLEKYVKGILVLNRVKAHTGHSVLPGVRRMKEHGKFELDLGANTVKFIKKLEDYGAEDRYYQVSYDVRPYDIVRLDRAVWEIRRYCQPLDRDIVDASGKSASELTLELDRVHRAKARHEKGTCVRGGHPGRDHREQGSPGERSTCLEQPFLRSITAQEREDAT
jgi:HEPN domain-containing protein